MPGWCAAGNRRAGARCCSRATRVAASWRGAAARASRHARMRTGRAHAARLLDDPDRLAALGAATALLAGGAARARAAWRSLPRPSPGCWTALDSEPLWAQSYVAWECDLLAGLGFGLDLACCAATGATDDLAYVSPRSGRAVSRDAGRPYHDKLLPLPDFLWREAPAEPGRHRRRAGLDPPLPAAPCAGAARRQAARSARAPGRAHAPRRAAAGIIGG